ncbi:discoidin domain-containing protein [Cohnella fermenti]|uniref:Uncharacterized protein n=1 Tax=Cohnella fermenti TaxID=2565925 RepID=A0A4S4C6L1_9BACL|nr:discoidin domain-containing protein [Cohnella fermenti]THF83238.1 hypothetical protein E6C55_05120 [Cohnella fermenti]
MRKSLLIRRRIRKGSGSKFGLLFMVLAILAAYVPISLSLPADAQAASPDTTLKVYPAPSGVTLNSTYTVKVRVPGGEWQDLDEYNTRVGNGSTVTAVSFVSFDMDGPVELLVKANTETIATAEIRPASNNLIPTIDSAANTIAFTITEPTKLSVEINGNVQKNLHVFANPLEVDAPNPDDDNVLVIRPGDVYTPSDNDPEVIYVAPGYYKQDFTVGSGRTLYIAGGAAINGGIVLDNATNAKVLGRGVLDLPSGKAISADYTNQIVIDGIIVNDYGYADAGGCAIALGNATNVYVNNFKAFSFNKWGDGIDTFAATNITINDIFMRTSDDAIALYNSRHNSGRIWSGNSANISVTNSVLMPGLAHPLNIATHGDPSKPGGGESFSDLNFSNLDILLDKPYSVGPIRLDASDGNLIINANFSDIRIDDRSESVGKVVEIRTVNNAAYGLGAGRGINNIRFKNITYNGSNSNGSAIYGYDATRLTQNITFENLVINGNSILNAAAGNFTVGNYTRNINFIATGGTVPEAAEIAAPVPVNIAYGKSVAADDYGSSWTADLGQHMNITGGTQITWGSSGPYPYRIETSNDNVNWTLKDDQTLNMSAEPIQSDFFLDTARYVKLTLTNPADFGSANLVDFKVFGEPTNLALGKTATASSSETGAPASNGSDGNPTSLWQAAEEGAGPTYTVDLGAVRRISYGTQVTWTNSGIAHQYKIETSMDNIQWNLAADKTGSTSTEQVRSDYFAATARYVRLTVTGLPTGVKAGIYDFKVWGNPINLAQNKPSTASSSAEGYPASNGTDANSATRWSAADRKTDNWFMVDLGEQVNITEGTQLMWEKIGQLYKYRIETSADGLSWITRIDKVTTTDNQGNTKSSQVQSDYFVASSVRYVKVTVTGLPEDAAASFYEFKVFGESGQASHQVGFNSDGGSPEFDPLIVPDGGTIEEPEAQVVKDRYSFEGWYSGDQKWNFADDIVTSDVVLRAHWALVSPETIEAVEILEDATVKKNYGVNDLLSVKGLNLKVIWEDGGSIIIPVTEEMVSGFNSNSAAQSAQTLTVAFEGHSDTYEITVPAKLDVANEATVVASHDEWVASGTPTPKEVVGYRLFDGNINTFGDLNAAKSYYDIDFGERAVKLTDVLILPRFSSANNVSRLNGAYLAGSNDKLTWTKLTTNISNAQLGIWHQYGPEDLLADGYYRYFRLTNDSNWYGNVAEVVFYGAIFEPQSVEVSPTSTYKKRYRIGDSLNVEGLRLDVGWGDGVTTQVSVTADEVSGFDSSELGDKTLTVTYGGFTASFTVSIVELVQINVLEEALVAASSKEWGTNAEPDVAATRIFDGSTETYGDLITGRSYYDIDFGDNRAARLTDVRLLPRNNSGTVARMNGAYLLGSNDKQTWTQLIGNVSNAVLGVWTEYDLDQLLDQGAYRYFRLTNDKDWNGNLAELELYGAVLEYQTAVINEDSAHQTEYAVGESLNVEGLKLDIVWNDGSRTSVPVTESMTSGFDSSEPAESQLLTVTYGDYTASYTVSIVEPVLTITGIAISDQSTHKTQYLTGDALSVDGLKLAVSWSDDSVTIVDATADMVSGFDSSAAAASQTLTAAYGGYSATYTVSVAAPEQPTITGIAISDQSTHKTQYLTGDALSVDGLKLAVSWSDDSVTIVDATADMVSGFDSSAAAASQTLTAAYGGYSATYTVSVAAPEQPTITGIAISDQSTHKTQYLAGDALSVDGLKLAVRWSDDSVTIVDATADMVSGFNSAAAASSQAVTVAYEGFIASYIVTIAAIPVTPVTPVQYAVSFDANGGTASSGMLVVIGSAVGSLPMPTREGYVFEGWFTSGGEPVSASTIITSNMTLVAHWSLIEEENEETPVTPEKLDNSTTPVVPFKDVTESNWAKKDIDRLVKLGAISGYADGSFKPEAQITRAEFLKILVLAMGLKSQETKVFTDTKQHWAKDYISIAGSLGIVFGRAGDMFAPDEVITRQEMAIMLARSGKLSENATGTSGGFIDQEQIPVWADEAIGAIISANIMNGYPDGSFKPARNATRAEAAAVIVRLLDYVDAAHL